MPGYGDYCGVSKTAEILCERWTVLVLRELLSGSTRFREIHRGVPTCPPATLTKRLKTLERHGIVERTKASGAIRYRLTSAGNELYPIVQGFGEWGQRWARSTYTDGEIDADALLWDVRRFLDPAGLGVERATVQFDIRSNGPLDRFWFVVEPTGVDLCVTDPLRPIDLLVASDLRTLVKAWMGDADLAARIAAGDVEVRGPRSLQARLPGWIGRHPVLGSIPPARPPRPVEAT